VTFSAADPTWEARFIEAMSGGARFRCAYLDAEESPGDRGWATPRRVAARAAVCSTGRAIVVGRSDCGAWPASRSGLKRDPGMSGR
jgi:hypothetical protein